MGLRPKRSGDAWTRAVADRVEFHDLFDCDIREAVGWYDKRSRQLGDRFVRLVKAAIAEASNDPYRFPRFEGEARYAPLARLPYVVLFEPTDGWIFFAGVMHTARDPMKWRERLT